MAFTFGFGFGALAPPIPLSTGLPLKRQPAAPWPCSLQRKEAKTTNKHNTQKRIRFVGLAGDAIIAPVEGFARSALTINPIPARELSMHHHPRLSGGGGGALIAPWNEAESAFQNLPRSNNYIHADDDDSGVCLQIFRIPHVGLRCPPTPSTTAIKYEHAYTIGYRCDYVQLRQCMPGNAVHSWSSNICNVH